MARRTANSASIRSAPQAETEKIKAVVLGQEFPPGVLSNFELELGEDHTGYPSVVVAFTVEKDRDPTKAYVAQLNQFAQSVSLALLEKDASRWPYIKFVTQP